MIEAISKGVGTGLVRSDEPEFDRVPKTDYSFNLPGRQCGILLLNLNLKPSPLMVTDESLEDA